MVGICYLVYKKGGMVVNYLKRDKKEAKTVGTGTGVKGSIRRNWKDMELVKGYIPLPMLLFIY